MSRIRNIKPSFFTDEVMVELSRDIRLFYIALWTECDQSGVFEWKPKQLKLRLFSADLDFLSSTIEGFLNDLMLIDRIRKFQHNGDTFGVVVQFTEHQAISFSEKERGKKFAPIPKRFPNRSVPVTEPSQNGSGTLDIGRRTYDVGQRTKDKGLLTRNPRVLVGPVLTDSAGKPWQLSEGHMAGLVKDFPNVDIPKTLETIAEHCTHNPQWRRKASGMLRAIQSWMGRASLEAPKLSPYGDLFSGVVQSSEGLAACIAIDKEAHPENYSETAI